MTPPEPTDQQYRDALYRIFDLADELLNGTSAGTLWPDVMPASQMESDNAETEPFQMAHIIQTVLNAAIEHLHATAGLIRKTGLLHNSPPFTMCRAAVETAATAYWLLQPEEQRARLWRHLVYVRQDTYDYEKVSKLMVQRMPGKVPADFAMRRTWADQVKSKHHLTGLPNQMVVIRVIQDVDAAIAVSEQWTSDHHIEIFWRTASGFGHGRQWATLNALVRDEVTPLGNATATIRLSNTESRVLWGAAAAYEIIDQSLRLYYAACGHERPTADG